MFSDRRIPDKGLRGMRKIAHKEQLLTSQGRNVLPYGVFNEVGLIVDVQLVS